jgi:hypothetical protein
MKSKSLFSIIMLMALLCMSTMAEAAPTAAEITGEIEFLTLNNSADIYSGGVMYVGGSQIILPKNLLIDLPANRLTLQQIFDQAPAACKATGESGLAKADKCNSSTSGGFVSLSGVHSTAGNIIAGDVLIEKGLETTFGVVSYISYTDGYFMLNGTTGDPTTGVMVRLNDPTGRHTVQQGLGCAGGPNCSPDPRFTLDPDNYTNVFSSGYPFCIPSTVTRTFPGLPAVTGIPAIGAQPTQAAADGTGDLLCPSTNRTPALAVEPDVNDSRRFAPIALGDSITTDGNFEMINGVRFFSAHSTRVNKALSTKNLPDQPDYMFLEEVFIEAPSFQNQRARMLNIGFTTLAPTDVDFWSIHRDPTTNAIHEFPLASVQGCDNAVGAANGAPGFPNGSCSQQGLIGAGGNIFRIRYDVDFLLAHSIDPKIIARYPGGAREDLNPCWMLLNSPRFSTRTTPPPTNPGLCPGGNPTTGVGITLEHNFGIMSPIPHEIQGRTGHFLDNPGLAGKTIDVNGAVATNGQYLFPFGMNLGGIETADFLEIDINLLNTPRTFEGIPWNLDRRLSPGGCLNVGGCEAGPLGSFALDPFPFTGLDPRLQAEFLVAGLPGGTPKGTFTDPNYSNTSLTTPTFGASNRVFSYVNGTPFAGGKYNFDGNNTLLPCSVGFPANCPPDPPLITIVPTPLLNIYPPITDEDAAATITGVPVTIDVLANDIPILGLIDPASLKIVTPPGSGTAVINPDHTITYTPTIPFTVGTVTFTYTVANNYGSVSLPGTVTVTITSVFNITSGAGPNGSISPAGVTAVTSNTNQTYTITPNTGFMVAALSVDGTVLPGATSYTFSNVTADHYINAYFTEQTFTITASAGANGTVTPVGASTVLYGTSSTYNITPNSGFRVASLLVDGVTMPVASSYNFTSITGNHTISATFTNSFLITATAGANGTVTPAGASPVTGGTNMTYTITPNAGFAVASLIIDGVTLPAATSYTFTNVSADHTISATFTAAFSIASGAAPNGSISPAGTTLVLSGASQSYTITPNTGFMVAALSVDGTILPGATSYTFSNVTADHYINAYFTEQTLTVTASAGANGSISPAGASTVLYGTSKSYTITPNAGFQVANLVVDGVTLPPASSYSFTGITANHTISATFNNNFTITAVAGANGSVTPAGTTPVTGGNSQTYTFTPNAGLVVSTLLVDGVTLPGATSYTFSNVTANHTIGATFAPPPKISAGAGPNGAISPAGVTSATYGASQSYTITPNAGFIVAALVVDGALLPGATSYTFNNVTADHYINAYFEAIPASVNIIAAAGPDGSISPAGANVVPGGSNPTFTITPNAGFMVVALSVDGVVLPGATSYTFTNVVTDHYINAYFGPIPANVTITAGAGLNGSISPAGINVVAGGSNQTFTITPDAGFTVTALSVDGTVLPGATSYTFTNVTTDHYINAYFGP